MIIPYGKQCITDDDINAVVDVLNSDFLTQGPAVKTLEQEFSSFTNAKYSIAVTNGTAALHLAAKALGCRNGSKVLVPSLSFSASANCIRYNGGDVEFVDIDPKTYCINTDILEEKLLKSPESYSGIVVVDFAGYPANLEAISQMAKKHNLWIIEDACHAPGASFYDKNNIKHKAGDCSFADATVFSFHPVKHIAMGEGGLITTNSQNLNEKFKLLRSHGITKDPKIMHRNDGPWYQEMHELGYNYRLSDIHAALGLSQLKRIEANLTQRNRIAKIYKTELSDLDIIHPYTHPNTFHAFHLYVIQTENREQLYYHLRKKNIFAQVHYPPIHSMPYYEQLYGKQNLPIVENYYSKCLSLPMFHEMSSSEQEYVIESVREFYEQ